MGKAGHIQRGLYCEQLVAEYFAQKEYRLIKHRWKKKWGEIDLLFYCQDRGWLMVEVKSIFDLSLVGHCLSPKQAQRLSNFLHGFMVREKLPVRLHLAVVDKKDNITVYEDVLINFF